MAGKMLFFFAVCSFAAWFLLFAGIGTRRDAKSREDRENTRTTGVIVAYVPHEMRTGRRGSMVSWRPIVEYTAEGQSCRGEYDNSMDRAQFPEGMNVEVLYDVSAPDHFHLEADPVFIHKGAGAIRVALIWILASAALTILLAVFVGGARFDWDGTLPHATQFFNGRR